MSFAWFMLDTVVQSDVFCLSSVMICGLDCVLYFLTVVRVCGLVLNLVKLIVHMLTAHSLHARTKGIHKVRRPTQLTTRYADHIL